MPLDDEKVGELLATLDSQLDRIESLSDPLARDSATDAVQILLQVYGEALERVMKLVESDPGGRTLTQDLIEDELVSHLLLLHGLHPSDLEGRILGALEEVRPYLESHGGDVEFVRVEGDVAYLRLQGSCSGCPSSAMTLKMAIEDAIGKAAPELERVEAVGVGEPQPASEPTPGFVPLSAIRLPVADGRPAARDGEESTREDKWTVVGGLPQLAGGGVLIKDVAQQPVMFLKVNDTFYAYRDRCPSCATSLGEAALHGSDLQCPGCYRSYNIVRAGRCLDAPGTYLEPIPLLVEDGGLVKVAIPSGVG
jgi:Fe-S cluster biogenesis protein NfuA/nitrite reductase/ring-hydroxylating ferredoxin subunit